MSTLVEVVADKVSDYGVRLAYGDPVVIDGVSIVPVAIAYVGFGAGSGNASGKGEGKAGGNALWRAIAETEEKPTAKGDADMSGDGNASGEGGGGGGGAIPIGAYVKSGDTAVFQPNVIALAAVAVPLVIAAGWALRGIIKVLR